MDFTTPVGQVRLLISDLSPDEPLLSDDMIRGYLTLAGDNLRRAAAEALDAIASSEVLVSKVIRTQDRATDGAAVAAELRKHAAALRRRADEEDAEHDPFFSLTAWGSGTHEAEETRL